MFLTRHDQCDFAQNISTVEIKMLVSLLLMGKSEGTVATSDLVCKRNV